MKDVDLEEPTSAFRSRLLGVYSAWMQPQWDQSGIQDQIEKAAKKIAHLKKGERDKL